MSRKITLAAALAAMLTAGATHAAPNRPTAITETRIAQGKTLFSRKCAPCHGAGPGDDGAPMLPATAVLAARYRGQLPAALDQRQDLGADTIRHFVRHGSGGMPMFRRAELSDGDIDAIAAYIATHSRRP